MSKTNSQSLYWWASRHGWIRRAGQHSDCRIGDLVDPPSAPQEPERLADHRCRDLGL